MSEGTRAPTHHHPTHGHEHPRGFKGWLREVFVPHSHDAADSIDDALTASDQGVRAVKVSLVVLGITAAVQLGIVAVSGSVALLADTIHNFSDALTAVPLWIAFVLGRRTPTARHTHEPQPLHNLGWVLAAGVIGFAGNEAVAVYRIRVGRRIGSAALVADGVHARTDGFTSLAVILGVVGVWVGFPLADPLVGLLITAAVLVLLWGTARDVGRRLLDGVDPDLTRRAEHTLTLCPEVHGVEDVRLRWTGHRLAVQGRLRLTPGTTVAAADQTTSAAEHAVRHALPAVGTVDLTVTANAQKAR